MNSPTTMPCELICEMIERLGAPPQELMNDWIEQAKHCQRELPAEWNDPAWAGIGIDENGRLVFPERPASASTAVEAALPLEKKKNRPLETWILVASVGLLIIGVGWWSLQGSNKFASAPTTSVPTPNPFDPNFLEPTRAPEAPKTKRSAPTKRPSTNAFSLDSILPPSTTELPSTISPALADEEGTIDVVNLNDAPENSDLSSEATPSVAMDPISDAVPDDPVDTTNLLLDDSDEAIVDAVDQETKSVPVEIPARVFVSLPPIPKNEEDSANVLIPFPKNHSPQLSFPIDVDLKLRADDADGYEVVEVAEDVVIGQLTRSDDGLSFAWTLAAQESDAARKLHHGRLSCESGAVWMRPMLSADAVPIDFESRDTKLMWQLGGLVPANVTRLDLEVKLPENVDIGWIEPIDRTSPRKGRGIAVFNLKDSETAAAVVRMDWQTNTNCSIRIRTAARIAPEMPWQWTDRKGVQDTLLSVTSTMEAMQAQLTALDASIGQAKRIGNRRAEAVMSMQREPIDATLKKWQSVVSRLSELDALLAVLASGAKMDVTLSVDWEDQRQVLLESTGE